MCNKAAKDFCGFVLMVSWESSRLGLLGLQSRECSGLDGLTARDVIYRKKCMEEPLSRVIRMM